jgi:thioredoxin reductase
VDDVRRGDGGIFTVVTTKEAYRARCVLLALGRRGTPRKLGIPGEELPKVMYSLLEADAYTNADILVVGGGDSAVEAAMGLAHQKGNRVTLSYRKDAFGRIKDRNAQRIRECTDRGMVQVLFQSMPLEIAQRSVLLDSAGERREIPNDFTWVLAGGIPPNEFLAKIGVAIGPRDLTREAMDAA